MKKIFVAVALLFSVFALNAQPKNVEAALKAVEKAKVAAENPKKATKPATWIKLAETYLDAYNYPTQSVILGSPRMEVKMFLKGQQILETVEKTGAENQQYSVDILDDKELWYNTNGILELIKVTKPVMADVDMLALAQEALTKAAEVDPKKSKEKDILELFEQIHKNYQNDALSAYYMGNVDEAVDLFKLTCASYNNPIVNKIDSLNTYYTALFSAATGNNEQAKDYYNKCLDMKFYQEGSTYSNMAEIYKAEGNVEKAKEMLETGFVQFPQSQPILVSLINLYIETNDDPNKLFDLLHKAQENEPNNASLYYVEGDVHKKLGNKEQAIALFQKSVEVDPNYVYGPFSIGSMYYDDAVELQNKANEELDDAKYMVLVEQFDATLKSAIEPFEQAFKIAQDPEIKSIVAEYLKNIYFRYRDDDPKYLEMYKMYDAFSKGEVAE